MVESVFSSLDRLGLSERPLVHRQSLSRQGIVPYRKTQGLVFHLYAVLLGYGLFKLMEHSPAWRLLLAQLGGMWLVAFPNWGLQIFVHNKNNLVKTVNNTTKFWYDKSYRKDSVIACKIPTFYRYPPCLQLFHDAGGCLAFFASIRPLRAVPTNTFCCGGLLHTAYGAIVEKRDYNSIISSCTAYLPPEWEATSVKSAIR